MDPDLLDQIAKTGLHYGPFFFSVFFLMYINQRVYKNWRDATGPARVNTLRGIYVVTVAFSLTLVLVAVVWWLVHTPPIRTFQGKLLDLSQTHSVWSDKLYFRSVHRPSWWHSDGEGLGEGPTKATRTEEFLVAEKRNLPFHDGEHFGIVFRGSDSKETDLRLKYCARPQPEYRILPNLKDRDVIVSVTCTRTSPPAKEASMASLLPGLWQVANAAEPDDSSLATESPSAVSEKKRKLNAVLLNKGKFNSVSEKNVKRNVVTALQAELTDTPTKTLLLKFVEKDKSLLKEYLMVVTKKEPFVLTILDLTRHTDDILSSKAETLLADFDLATYLLTLLKSEPNGGKGLVKQILAGRRHVDTAALSQADGLSSLLSDVRRRALVPTASHQGDRYYVRASWSTDEGGADTRECLTALFNQELITDRTLHQEAAIMDSLKGSRFVYWYSKEWTEYMARRIESCGAMASFTSGTTSA